MNLPEISLSANVIDEGKMVDPHHMILLTQLEYVMEVSLRVKKTVPQRVFAPRFKKPKNYSYFVTVENGNGKILAWKRTSVVKNTTVKLPFTLSQVGSEELVISVLCDSVTGLDERLVINTTVTGDEEEVKRHETSAQNLVEYMDDEMDAEQFEDDVYDEYLADLCVCWKRKWRRGASIPLPLAC